MQRHKEAYAGLCQFVLRDYRVSRPQLQQVSDRLIWHQRSWLGLEDEWTPQNLGYYPPFVLLLCLSVQVLLWGLEPY